MRADLVAEAPAASPDAVADDTATRDYDFGDVDAAGAEGPGAVATEDASGSIPAAVCTAATAVLLVAVSTLV